MSFADQIKEQASRLEGKLILPEGNDERMIEAARRIVSAGIADEIYLLNCQETFSESSINILNPGGDRDCEELAHRLSNNVDDISLPEAEKLVKTPLYYGAGLVAMNQVDAMVAGAVNSTADVLRSALHLIGVHDDSSVVSSSFLMELEDKNFGSEGRLLFADPGVIPDPDVDQLPDIAADTVRTYENLIGTGEPRVAFLSFSSHGSAEHPLVEKMQEVTEKFTRKYPAVVADGELQADAALVPEVAQKKVPDSELAGDANILIFPDLDAANIGYKLVQRLAGAGAYGPLLQGLAGAVNDLSRGCSVEDIVTVSAISLVQGNSDK
ncbi:MAG: phosphate acyltransferase [bacterium]